MKKDTDSTNKDGIKKQTLVTAVLVSLFIGFIGGTVYSSFKLATDKQAVKQMQQQMPPQGDAAKNNISMGEQQDNSIEFSAKILQLEQYLEKNPKDAEAWAQLGHLFFDSNQSKNAIEAYEKSLAIVPDNTGVITDLGVMYRRSNQPEKAIETFDKAIAIDPAFETARFNKGVVLLHDLNDVEGGIKAWEELVEQNPLAMAPNGESVDSLVQKMKKQKQKSSSRKRKIRKLRAENLDFGGYSLKIVKKKIKHIYFRVYPSKEKIIVSIPVDLDPDTLNRAIISKSDWLNKQVKKGGVSEPKPIKTYITGDKIFFKGERYFLSVKYQRTGSKVCIKRIDLFVKPGSDGYDRQKIIVGWYRKELKQSIEKLIAKWQPQIGVRVNDFGVKKMKTRWGSCNIIAKRIWLNLALVKLAEPFLEYVIVHEMVHLLERRHNVRFKGFMDRFIPEWRTLKKELDLFGL